MSNRMDSIAESGNPAENAILPVEVPVDRLCIPCARLWMGLPRTQVRQPRKSPEGLPLSAQLSRHVTAPLARLLASAKLG